MAAGRVTELAATGAGEVADRGVSQCFWHKKKRAALQRCSQKKKASTDNRLVNNQELAASLTA